jgi:hypothetical protein
MFTYIARSIRYILPLVVLLLIATYLILSPFVHRTYAAAPTARHIAAPHVKVFIQDTPDIFWRGH